jgi:hypothetical protein
MMAPHGPAGDAMAASVLAIWARDRVRLRCSVNRKAIAEDGTTIPGDLVVFIDGVLAPSEGANEWWIVEDPAIEMPRFKAFMRLPSFEHSIIEEESGALLGLVDPLVYEFMPLP